MGRKAVEIDQNALRSTIATLEAEQQFEKQTDLWKAVVKHMGLTCSWATVRNRAVQWNIPIKTELARKTRNSPFLTEKEKEHVVAKADNAGPEYPEFVTRPDKTSILDEPYKMGAYTNVTAAAGPYPKPRDTSVEGIAEWVRKYVRNKRNESLNILPSAMCLIGNYFNIPREHVVSAYKQMPDMYW